MKSNKVNSPIIKDCDMHFECKIVARILICFYKNTKYIKTPTIELLVNCRVNGNFYLIFKFYLTHPLNFIASATIFTEYIYAASLRVTLNSFAVFQILLNAVFIAKASFSKTSSLDQ